MFQRCASHAAAFAFRRVAVRQFDVGVPRLNDLQRVAQSNFQLDEE
jgi:hypothetical protein